ncbi:trp operon leader peptide [Lelliottia wanjuensis]
MKAHFSLHDWWRTS